MNRELSEAAIEKLQKLQLGLDVMMEHILADNILCDLLCTLGYTDVVEEWCKVDKWYS